MAMVQPSHREEGRPTTMSPAPPTRARVMPWRRSTSMAACGVALGDAPDVEPHARLQKPDRPALGIQHHLVRPDQGAGLGELLGVGQLAVPPGSSPEPAHRRDRHVEGALGRWRISCLDRSRTSKRSALTGTAGRRLSARAGRARFRAGSR